MGTYQRDRVQWRIILRGHVPAFPYEVQWSPDGERWRRWDTCASVFGARFCLWRARMKRYPLTDGDENFLIYRHVP